MTETLSVLFLCKGNSSRSQMAEAFLRKYGGDRFDAYSAGLDPVGINPFAIRVMKEIGIELAGHRAKSFREYMGKKRFTYLITVCTVAEERCPRAFPGVAQRLHWPFDDPVEVQGSDEEKLEAFRRVRDRIEDRIKEWLSEFGIPEKKD